MGPEEVKGGAVVPESVLKKQKRSEEWALAKKQELEAAKKKNKENRKLIFIRAKQYAKEYEEQVQKYFMCFRRSVVILIFYFTFQQKELIRLKREAKLKGGFYVNPEAKLLFIIRIRGYVICGISVFFVIAREIS